MFLQGALKSLLQLKTEYCNATKFARRYSWLKINRWLQLLYLLFCQLKTDFCEFWILQCYTNRIKVTKSTCVLWIVQECIQIGPVLCLLLTYVRRKQSLNFLQAHIFQPLVLFVTKPSIELLFKKHSHAVASCTRRCWQTVLFANFPKQ